MYAISQGHSMSQSRISIGKALGLSGWDASNHRSQGWAVTSSGGSGMGCRIDIGIERLDCVFTKDSWHDIGYGCMVGGMSAARRPGVCARRLGRGHAGGRRARDFRLRRLVSGRPAQQDALDPSRQPHHNDATRITARITSLPSQTLPIHIYVRSGS